jgi:hypothetical protein
MSHKYTLITERISSGETTEGSLMGGVELGIILNV